MHCAEGERANYFDLYAGDLVCLLRAGSFMVWSPRHRGRPMVFLIWVNTFYALECCSLSRLGAFVVRRLAECTSSKTVWGVLSLCVWGAMRVERLLVKNLV